MKRLSVRIAGAFLAVSVLGIAVPQTSRALVELPGTCITTLVTNSCDTKPTMDGTFRYLIVNPKAEVQWSASACGSLPDSTCDGAYWLDGDSRSGVLTVTGCPCRAWISIHYPGPYVPNPLVFSFPIGIVTSIG
jgi:hypothetical protein